MNNEFNQVRILEKHFKNYFQIMDAMILLKLKRWRIEKAKEVKLPAFYILHNTDLIEIVRRKPRSIEDLKMVKGFGKMRILKYGDDIISMLNKNK
ncbi:MAG: HRDC domain-containing protein [Chitinophagales bacterium]